MYKNVINVDVSPAASIHFLEENITEKGIEASYMHFTSYEFDMFSGKLSRCFPIKTISSQNVESLIW